METVEAPQSTYMQYVKAFKKKTVAPDLIDPKEVLYVYVVGKILGSKGTEAGKLKL
jgi:hypothetical protein